MKVVLDEMFTFGMKVVLDELVFYRCINPKKRVDARLIIKF